jgi:hypothetical protein
MVVVQPPKKRRAFNREIIIILPYSARKNIEKTIEEYSTLYPATSSASASGRSKGVRLVSAIEEIKKMIAAANNGRTYQPVSSCANTMRVKLREPERMMTGRRVMLIETS